MATNFYNRFIASPTGAIVYSIMAGGIGVVVLVMFLAAMFSLSTVAKFIPWIIGFNAAVTGYSLIDKTRDRLPRKRLFAMGTGGFMALLVCFLFILAFGYGTLVATPQFFIYGIIGVVFGGFGAWVAEKKHCIE